MRTDTKALVLAVLAEEPRHGYGIAQAIRERSEAALKLGEGQLYPILHTLEEEGWILGEWQIQAGDPPKRVYAITPAGRTELETRTTRWLEFVKAVGSVLEPAPKMEASHE